MSFASVCILFFTSGFLLMLVVMSIMGAASRYDEETERMYRRDRVTKALREARGE